MIKAFLFDLDGTLLPMVLPDFLKLYFGALGKYANARGYDGEKFVKLVWHGTYAMIANDGKTTNEDCFWSAIAQSNPKIAENKDIFEPFYNGEFVAAKASTRINPYAVRVLDALKSKGYKIALATNPLFPSSAIRARLDWAGIDREYFDFITTYDNSYYAKPNPKYFEQTAKKLSLNPNECIMVGNDPLDDISGSKNIMDTYLVTDWLVNEKNLDYSDIKSGTFKEFADWIDTMPSIK